MYKFVNFPPARPGDVEFAAGSGMSAEEVERIGVLSHDAYMDAGAVLSHLLMANMVEPDLSVIQSIAGNLLDTYPLTTPNRAFSFMRGVMQVDVKLFHKVGSDV